MERSRPSRFLPDNMRSAALMLLAAVLLSACGYRGPLYLPKPKPEAQRPAPTPDATKEAAPLQ